MDTDTVSEETSTLVIGRSLSVAPGMLSYFHGELDELKIYDGSVSGEEIPLIYQP